VPDKIVLTPPQDSIKLFWQQTSTRRPNLEDYWSALSLCGSAEEVLVVTADDHGCRLRSPGGVYERLGARAIHLHAILTAV
jgi:hypothetical protein